MNKLSEEKNRGGRAQNQRLDKWLWYARLVKSRTLAANMIESGKVRLNRVRVQKSSQVVKVGDVITATIARRIRVVRVLDLGKRRGPAVEARSLYEELTQEGVAQSSLGGYGGTKVSNVDHGFDQFSGAQGARPRGTGRPTKKERRVIDRFRNGADNDQG